MILNKWNPRLHHYEAFETPAEIVVLYTPVMELPCDCTRCGIRMTFGDGYTSKQIHTDGGMGYPVCENCYEEELKEEEINA
jgi:hypothetical protein